MSRGIIRHHEVLHEVAGSEVAQSTTRRHEVQYEATQGNITRAVNT